MLLVAYIINANSFLDAWKGRAFYLFFLWLFSLESILGDGGDKQQKTNSGSEWARVVIGVFLLLIPTVYLMETYMFGLNNTVMDFGKFLGVGQGFREGDFKTWLITTSFPYSVEYLITAVSLILATYLLLGFKGLKQFSVSLFLLGAMGAFYMVDTFMPYGEATSLQALVPYTASSAAYILQQTGHVVQMVVLQQDGGVQMLVNGAPFLVYWPCAGVHSLFIYTFVILLFLKGSPMSLVGKAITLTIGAIGTFFVNVLRIVSIIQIYVSSGFEAGDYFHNYYGELYFLVWIVVFLFVLILVQRFLIRKKS
jgi:thaumarchaeosortase